MSICPAPIALARAMPVVSPWPERVEAALRVHPEADLRAVAAALDVATRTLQRALAQAGTPFQDVRRRVRLELACRLLVEPGSKVACVAREVGFASTPHFVGWFRRHSGATPSDFRRTAALSA